MTVEQAQLHPCWGPSAGTVVSPASWKAHTTIRAHNHSPCLDFDIYIIPSFKMQSGENRISAPGTHCASQIKWLFIRSISATGNWEKFDFPITSWDLSQQQTSSPCYHPLWSSDSSVLQECPHPGRAQQEDWASTQTSRLRRKLESTLFLGECSTHFSTVYVGNPNAIVPLLHEADHPAIWEARQGMCRAHKAAQEHHTHQTADILPKNDNSSGQSQENLWWGSSVLIRKTTEGITASWTLNT